MTHLSLQLRSENPPFGSDFRLAPGSQVRIGASPKADISIPFSGIADVSLIIGRSGNGLLYVSQPDGSSVRYIEPPAIVAVAPYHFVVTESASPLVTATPSQPSSRRRRGTTKQSPWAIIAGSIAALIFLGFVFAELRRPTQPPEAKSSTEAAPKNRPEAQTAQKEAPITPAPALALAPTPEPEKPALEPPIPVSEPAVAKILDFEELADKASKAVFTVLTKYESGEATGAGTAFAISPDGLAVTNYHVIKDAESISVYGANKMPVPIVRVVAVNPDADLALLSLKDPTPNFFELGNSPEMKIGASIAVYGAPHRLSGTLSTGIISARRRPGDFLRTIKFDSNIELIQITAPISPGSSGSPVMDRYGKVIGVATLAWVEEHSQNLNFAVPSAAVLKLREDAKKGLASVSPSAVISSPPSQPPSENSAADQEIRIYKDRQLAEFKRALGEDDYTKAMSISIELLAKYPKSATAHAARGTVLISINLPSEAEKYLSKALELDPKEPNIWYLHGIAQADQKKYSQSRQSLKRAVELKPSHVDAWQKRTTLSILLDDSSDAISSLQNVRILDPAMFQKWLTWYSNLKDPSPALKTLLSHFGVKSAAESSSKSEFHDLVIQIIDNYLASQEQGSAVAEASHFLEVVNPYYEKGRRSKAEIMTHIEAFRAQWPHRQFEFVKLEQADFINGFNLEITYLVRFTTSNGRNQRSGLMRQTLHLTEDGNRRWRISAIKTHTN